MSSPVDARDLLRDSVPIAVVLTLWAIPASLPFQPGTRQAFRVAGLAMAGLYVVVRGVRRGRQAADVRQPATLAEYLRENGWVLAVAGVWFLAAQVPWTAASLLVHDRALDNIAVLNHYGYVLNNAGIGTVLLYAVAVGRARLSDGPTDEGTHTSVSDPGPAAPDS